MQRPPTPGLSCRKPGSAVWHIHCEVETTIQNAGRMTNFLVRNMGQFPRARNRWMKKVDAFWKAPASVFYLFAPGGYTRILRLESQGGAVRMTNGSVEDPQYP